MTTTLLINITASETGLAYLEEGVLKEIQIERETKRGIVGNIYQGHVKRVLPGIQAAFIDIGLDKAGFLHAKEIKPDRMKKNESHHFQSSDITQQVYQGQYLMVQVVKDLLGGKGALLTKKIRFPSRYLVMMPGVQHVGVSQRIKNEKERERLKNIVTLSCDQTLGFIIRTAAENICEEKLSADVLFLQRLWQDVLAKKKCNHAKIRQLYAEQPLSSRILRDFAVTELDHILIDSKLTYDQLLAFTDKCMPEIKSKLQHYTASPPLFEKYNVENEIQHSLNRKVSLKSGGYLIIDQTEALTVIDINTGSSVGYHNLDETIFNTNLEATQAIARQLRLRNLGGIIIIDFIDMRNKQHRESVLTSLQEALSKDRVQTTISGFSPLGLVEMTRKRTRESIGQVFCHDCLTCQGKGRVKSAETVCYEILRKIVEMHRNNDANGFVVSASPSVGKKLQSKEFGALKKIVNFVGKSIKVQINPLYSPENFDVVTM